ncbi:MAG TPA: T9SS type A sorting domain-containing protein [Flavobacteriales bacterium]|nr:T9SS type A sorting domain-containing protein [Flavobacteriales bacterium]HIN40533.1 T9SS type A sorting domain-containing protein [Flavobacteriales bacterium]
MKTLYILNQNLRKRKSMFFSLLFIIAFFGFSNLGKSQNTQYHGEPIDRDEKKVNCNCWFNLRTPFIADNISKLAENHPTVFNITQDCDDNCSDGDKCEFTIAGRRGTFTGDCIDRTRRSNRLSDPNGKPSLDNSASKTSTEELRQFLNNNQTDLTPLLGLGVPYPNPASEYIAIPTYASEKILFAEVQIMDMLGRVLIQSNQSGNGLTEMGIAVNVTALPNGVYFCRVKVNNTVSEVTRIAVGR